jgi:hypothetical protein
MLNPKIQLFVNALQHGKRLSLLSETQVVCGNAVLTAEPNIESETLTDLRIEIPQQHEMQDFECLVIFVAAMFGESAVLQLRPQINALFNHGMKAALRVEGQVLRIFTEGENYVMTLELLPPPAEKSQSKNI